MMCIIESKESHMLFPYLYRCPEKLKDILHYDENEELYFVFGDKSISLEIVRTLVEKSTKEPKESTD
jgi:hypothetical protein